MIHLLSRVQGSCRQMAAARCRLALMRTVCVCAFWASCSAEGPRVEAAQLMAGVGRVDISEPSVVSNDPLYVKALVLKQDDMVAVLITVDAVAIGEIGPIRNDYLGNVRTELKQ